MEKEGFQAGEQVRVKAPHSPYRDKAGVIERFTASQKSVYVKFSGVVEAKRVLVTSVERATFPSASTPRARKGVEEALVDFLEEATRALAVLVGITERKVRK
jgi:DNA-binding sugar fermentation-stimulating protein